MRRPHIPFVLVAMAGALSTGNLYAQTLADAPSTVMLARNLQPRQVSAGTSVSSISGVSGTPAAPQSVAVISGSGPIDSVPQQLTLREAEQIAVRNNPRIQVSQLLARAQHQVYRATRSAYLPQVEGGAVGARAADGSRFTFDGLRSTRLLTHVGGGLDFHQLITDFGHTSNSIAASKLQEKAQNSNALASRLDIILMTDQAFYNTLEAQALVKVAQQTVDTRNTTNEQIKDLTQHKLRSDVDLAFSRENLAQANLLLLDAQAQYESDLNDLTSLMGFDRPMQYTPMDTVKNVPLPPPDADALVEMALKQRPDLMALNYDWRADEKFSRAEREQMFPSLSAIGVVGGTPVRDDRYFTSNWFGAVGASLEVPIFNGFLYNAQASAADARARAAQQKSRDLRDRVARDVRNACLQANTSYRKIAATEKFLEAANLALRLSQERYKLGLSSIVELSQSQLAQTQASIQNVNAKFAYKLSLAVLDYQIGNLP